MGWTRVVDLIRLCLFTYSRGLGLFVAGSYACAAVRNVRAHAALPCLLQDWAVHGKTTLVGCSRLDHDGNCVFQTFAGVSAARFDAVPAPPFVFCSNYCPSGCLCSCLPHRFLVLECVVCTTVHPVICTSLILNPCTKSTRGREDADANEATREESLFHSWQFLRQ